MARPKRSIGIYVLGEETFDGFTADQRERLSAELGRHMSPQLAEYLEGELNGWLVRFGRRESASYGAAERREVKAMQNSAKDLRRRFEAIGGLATHVLDRFAYRRGIENEAFLALLDDLQGTLDHLDRMASDKVNFAAMQIHAVASGIEAEGVPVTTSHATGGTPFSPSTFVRFIDCHWEIDPRLRLHPRKNAGYWPGLSQWISARLSEDPEFEKLVLVRRPKLK